MELRTEVYGHLNQLFTEIEMAIPRFPDDIWNRAGDPGKMLTFPRFLAHHTVWCLTYDHLLQVPSDRVPHNPAPEYGTDIEIPKERILDLLREIWAYTEDVYGKMSDEEYMAGDGKGFYPIGRIIYAIAHTRHHYGQMVQVLRDAGIEDPSWYPLR